MLPLHDVFVGVVGTRSRDTMHDYIVTERAFRKIWLSMPLTPKGTRQRITIVSGGCKKGGDRFAEMIALKWGFETLIHLPDESKLDQDILRCNRAQAYAIINYERNTLIARDSTYALIACVADDRKGGTEDTIKKFQKFHPDKEVVTI